jgi:hypothetical protein
MLDLLLHTCRQAEEYARLCRARSLAIAEYEDLTTRWRQALVEEVGEANLRRLRDYARLARTNNFGQCDVTPVPEGLAKLQVARARIKRESVEIMRDFGVNHQDAKRVHARFHGELQQITAPPLKESGRLELVPQDKVPAGVLARKGNPWTIYTPPFAGWWWSYSWWRSGFSNPELYNYVSSSSGSTGHRSDVWEYSASDFDAFSLEFDTHVGLWYQPTEAGQVDIWIKARCSAARSHYWLDDEWGWSDSYSLQRAYMTVNVSPHLVDQEANQIWWSWASGSPDNKTYVNDWYNPNGVYWFHLKTSDPIPANQWSLIKVGTKAYRWTWMNDVETWQMMRNRWFIEEVYVDIA